MYQFWWSVMTLAPSGERREFYVKGGTFFEGAARTEAEARLEDGEIITSWQRKEPYNWIGAGGRPAGRTVAAVGD